MARVGSQCHGGGGGYVTVVPVAARSKVRVYALSPAGIAGSNPSRDMDACLARVVFCQVEVSATS